MKNLFFVLFALSTFILYGQEDFDTYGKNSILLRNLRINLQANVLQNFSISKSSGKKNFNIGNTVSAGLEFVWLYDQKMDYGIGIFYQTNTLIDTSIGKIGFIPIYAFIDFPLIQNDIFPVQFTSQLGYSFLSIKNGAKKVNDGIYHALGITFVISKYTQLKFLYSHNYGKINLISEDYSFRKENLTIALYYKF